MAINSNFVVHLNTVKKGFKTCSCIFVFQMIFGTGDFLEAVTVTANTGFVRAAGQKHLELAVYLHPSRALTEQKQKTAKKIN